jgi:hypothetical protein
MLGSGVVSDDPVNPKMQEYADQTVAYVRRALGVALEYDSDTLPLLDHYLRTVPQDQPATLKLVLATAGAYFGEVARRRLGGRWERGEGEPGAQEETWRLVLPTGLNFSPVGFVASAIAKAELEDHDTEIDAPPRMRPYVQQALARMGEVTEEEYYSLCGRLDTIEHLHEVLVAVAAQMLGAADDPDAPEAAEGDEPETPLAVADEPSGAVN